jgi:hypothetical protein
MRARRQGRCWAALTTGLAALVVPSAAGGAVTVGQTFTPPDTCVGDKTVLQTGSPGGQYTVPSPGVITSWSFQAPGFDLPNVVKLKVGHPEGGNNLTILGESGPHNPTANMLNTYTDVRIPVQPGDVIGLYPGTDATSMFCRDPAPGFSYHIRDGDTPPGGSNPFSPFDNIQFDVSASLEPDCDNDGFGDETQDPDTASCNPPPARGNRTVTLDTNKNKVLKGKNVRLTGRVVETRQGACAANQPVQLQRKKPSQSTFTTVEQLQTDAAGGFSTKEKVKKTYEYRAQVPETEACLGQTSNTEKVKVKKKKR